MALARAVVEVPARAGIHSSREHEARGESQRHGGARDTYSAILERLAHDFQNIARELGQFIEKKYAIVRERDFARPRYGSPADQSGIGDCVMR